MVVRPVVLRRQHPYQRDGGPPGIELVFVRQVSDMVMEALLEVVLDSIPAELPVELGGNVLEVVEI